MPSEFSTAYESVVVFGKVMKVLNKDEIAFLFIQKYSSNFIDSGMEYIKKMIEKISVFEIQINKITAKRRSRK